MSVTHIVGNLFNVPSHSIILQSCNCQGMWRTGIAVDFKQKFPLSFRAYEDRCTFLGDKALGTHTSCVENGHLVVSLFVSINESHNADPAESILLNTEKALISFITAADFGNLPLNMPKINSGRFNVPWEKTEEILQRLSDQYHVNFQVWSPLPKIS